MCDAKNTTDKQRKTLKERNQQPVKTITKNTSTNNQATTRKTASLKRHAQTTRTQFFEESDRQDAEVEKTNVSCYCINVGA